MEKRKEPVKIRVDLAKPKNLAIAFFALFIIFSVIFYSQAGFIGVEANIVTNAIIPSALVSLGLTGFAHQYLSLAKKINKKIAIEKTGQMANTK